MVPVPLHYDIIRTYHAQKNALRPRMAEVGLSPGQPKILHYLVGHSSAIQKDIADNCDIATGTVSRLLNNMEQNGLIERRDIEGNRRATSIVITQKGKLAIQGWDAICAEVSGQALDGFTEEEAKLFHTYLHRMYHNLTGKHLPE